MSRAFAWTDPFDDLSDDEFDEQIAKLARSQPSSVAVSLRISPDLLGRVRRQAALAGVPYQTFMKSVLEAGVGRLERKRPARRPSRRASR
jgi:predicted DNA binding CopG/RHH family protein